jgi:alkanesulfonate monooxygenase SsuD/methylene tetrahydromethanopterin reductase-like flavin-dependent oxidoreductase (luciferase family)
VSGRIARFKESLEVIRALWSGNVVDFKGEYHTLVAAQQNPVPLTTIPIVIGGAGERTLQAVAAHADWWNLPIYALDKLDELRPLAGSARVSTQEMIGFVPSETERSNVLAAAAKRFGATGMGRSAFIGDARELCDHFAARRERGVERFYVWFLDFAQPDTLAAFGRDVIAAGK